MIPPSVKDCGNLSISMLVSPGRRDSSIKPENWPFMR